jgi:hypothetical protein
MRRLEEFDAASKLHTIAERYRSQMPVRISDAQDVMNPDRPFRVLLPEGEEQRVFGERIEVYRAGVLVEERVLPWAERIVRKMQVWWRNRTMR